MDNGWYASADCGGDTACGNICQTSEQAELPEHAVQAEEQGHQQQLQGMPYDHGTGRQLMHEAVPSSLLS